MYKYHVTLYSNDLTKYTIDLDIKGLIHHLQCGIENLDQSENQFGSSLTHLSVCTEVCAC